MKGLFILLGAFLVIASNDAQNLTMRGRVVFPSGPNTPIESDGILVVELRDTSLANAIPKLIAKGIGKALRFPMAFAIKYAPQQAGNGIRYSLTATIRNKVGKLLYINAVSVPVIPVGSNRTTTIDVPVKCVKQPGKGSVKGKWFELVGKTGAEAVEIIKSQTGFRNVMAINERSPITMDYRTDRVRVFVNDKGIVTRVPSIA